MLPSWSVPSCSLSASSLCFLLLPVSSLQEEHHCYRRYWLCFLLPPVYSLQEEHHCCRRYGLCLLLPPVSSLQAHRRRRCYRLPIPSACEPGCLASPLSSASSEPRGARLSRARWPRPFRPRWRLTSLPAQYRQI